MRVNGRLVRTGVSPSFRVEKAALRWLERYLTESHQASSNSRVSRLISPRTRTASVAVDLGEFGETPVAGVVESKECLLSSPE
jgi:hypothetical protein